MKTDEAKEIAVVLGYNEYKQITGSVFYAIEMYLALIEKHRFNLRKKLNGIRQCDCFANGTFVQNEVNDTRIKFYIVNCHKPRRKGYLDAIKKLICEKYPISSGSNKQFMNYSNKTYSYVQWGLSPRKHNNPNKPDSMMKWLSQNITGTEYKNLIETQFGINALLANIEFVSNDHLEFIKAKKIFMNNTSYLNYNSKLDTNNVFYTNRANKNLTEVQKLSIIINSNIKNTILYEYPEQDPFDFITMDQADQADQANTKGNIIQEPLKIGFKYFIPKILIDPCNQTLISDPGNNLKRTFQHKIDTLHDLRMFGSDDDPLYFHSRWDQLLYYEDLNAWDENNRLIPECIWYDKEFKIIKRSSSKYTDSAQRRSKDITNIALDPIRGNEPLIDWALTSDIPYHQYKKELEQPEQPSQPVEPR